VKLGRISIDAECSRSCELILAVAAAQQSDAEHSRTTRSQEIPDRIADDITVVDGDAEALLTIEEEIRRGFGSQHVATFYDDGLRADVQGLERAINLRSASGGGDAVGHAGISQSAQELHSSGQGSALWQELAKQLPMPLLQSLRLIRCDFAADLFGHSASEQAPTHSDAPVNAPPIDGQSGFRQRSLPGEDVGINGINESSIEIENQRRHRPKIITAVRFSSYSPCMDRAPALGDLVTILYRPRQTMRRILDSGRDRWAVQIVLLAFVCASVSDSDVRGLSEFLPNIDLLSVIAVVLVALIVGAAMWVLALFILSWIAAPIGRMLGGTGTVADVRAALAWAMVPMIWSVIYRIPLAVFKSRMPLRPDQHVKDIFLNFIEHGGCALITVVLALQIVLTLWSVFVASGTLAEAQQFSTEKGFVNFVIAIALPLLVIGVCVFTFRR
jgi:hypothetical protein